MLALTHIIFNLSKCNVNEHKDIDEILDLV